MAAGEVRTGDVGTIFEFTIKDQDSIVINISSATTKQITLRSPYGKILTNAASFTTDGTDGKMRYVTVAGDIDATGVWQAQGKVITAAGTFKTDIQQFNVYANIS